MRYSIFLLVLIASAVSVGCQQPTSPESHSITLGDPAAIEKRRVANSRAASLLATYFQIKEHGYKLTEAIDLVRDKTGAPIEVNWNALEAAGVEREALINLRGGKDREVTGAGVLDSAVHQLSDFTTLEPVGYVVRDGVVLFSTKRELRRATETRVYSIRDLIEPLPRLAGALGFKGDEMTIRIYLPGRPLPTTLFSEEDGLPPPHNRDEAIEAVVETIQDTIGVQAEWTTYGGDVSSLRELDGDLIIKTSPENHDAITELFNALRASRAADKRRFDEQLENAKRTGVTDLTETLLRIERKFDQFNIEYAKQRKQDRTPGPGEY